VNFELARRENPSAFSLNNESDVFPQLNQQVRMRETNVPIIAYHPCYLANYPLSNGQSEAKDTRYVEPFDAYDHALDEYVLDFKVLKTWLISKFHIENENGDTVFNLVRQALVGVNGMLNDAEQRRFTDMKVTYQESPKGNFVFIKKGVKLLETQLSSGERSLMTLVADIARRLVIANPLSKNPLLEGSGLILIDEIDLHLHPLWQRKVVGKLMELFPNVQFVVTTHSAEVLKEIDRDHLRRIKNGQLVSFAPFIKGRDSTAILSDAFGVSERSPEDEEKIKQLYRLMETDTHAAHKLLIELKNIWGETDLAIMRAESYLEIY
jgi:predicted ATP-binding protein involved in virulence